MGFIVVRRSWQLFRVRRGFRKAGAMMGFFFLFPTLAGQRVWVSDKSWKVWLSYMGCLPGHCLDSTTHSVAVLQCSGNVLASWQRGGRNVYCHGATCGDHKWHEWIVTVLELITCYSLLHPCKGRAIYAGGCCPAYGTGSCASEQADQVPAWFARRAARVTTCRCAW